MDYLGERGDVEYTDMVEALSKDYLDWYILTQVWPRSKQQEQSHSALTW